jgi:hypothetical protein
MKIRRSIYWFAGVLFVCLQVTVLIGSASQVLTAEERATPGFLFGYYFAKWLFSLLAILCGIGIYRVGRKLKKRQRQEQELLQSFDTPS